VRVVLAPNGEGRVFESSERNCSEHGSGSISSRRTADAARTTRAGSAQFLELPRARRNVLRRNHRIVLRRRPRARAQERPHLFRLGESCGRKSDSYDGETSCSCNHDPAVVGVSQELHAPMSALPGRRAATLHRSLCPGSTGPTGIAIDTECRKRIFCNGAGVRYHYDAACSR